MTTDPDRARISPHPDVLVQNLPGGETVLLHMRSEVYFGLDPVGARMWEALAETGDIEDAVARLMDVFEVEEDRLQTDIRELVAELTEAGLVEVTTA